jgi:HEAT repeat protein
MIPQPSLRQGVWRFSADPPVVLGLALSALDPISSSPKESGMTAPRRRTGLLAALVPSLLLLSGPTFGQSELKETFDRGVALLDEGDRAGALQAFQRALALDPSHEAAYELWKSTEHEVWLELLADQGEFQLIGQRLLDLAKVGREATRDDAAAVSALLDQVYGDDAIARRRAVLTLASQHGEYAVPQLLRALEDEVDGDRRVLAIHTLTEIGPRVVLPLIQAMRSDNAFLRRQVAYTLGYIGDQRAAPVLARHADGDEDQGVAAAAREALGRMGGSGDALAGYLGVGGQYRARDRAVLGAGMRSAVVWSWDGGLTRAAVPAYLYADELAKGCYYDALAVDPSSAAALAGIAGACAAQAGSLEVQARLGGETSDHEDSVRAGLLAVAAAGPTALDAALAGALDAGDDMAAIGLCRALGAAAGSAGPALSRALAGQAPVSTEAALALGRIALRSRSAADGKVIEALAHAASREILRVAGIIDADAQRASVVKNELEGRGVLVRSWSSGASGLASMRRGAGFDLLVVADSLPDLTVQQVLGEIRDDYRTADTPLVMAAVDADLADELWGDKVAGVLTTSDLSALDEALSGDLTGERALAQELARGAALTLAHLAKSGANLASVQPQLAGALSQDDEVSVPLMTALAHTGDVGSVGALTEVLASSDRSDEARVAAADALAAIFARSATAGGGATDALIAVATSGDSFDVRLAASRALGNLGLDAAARLGLLNDVRSGAAE